MYLLFDASAQDEITLTLFDEHQKSSETYDAKNRELLTCVASFLTAREILPADIRGIAVILGAGSFTSTRIATTVANAWGYAMQIPVIGLTKDDALNLPDLLQRFQRQPICQYISATYSGMPNIGKQS